MKNDRGTSRLIPGRKWLLSATLVLFALGSASADTYGAVNVPETIRVGLFLDLGSKYRSTTPAATLVSTGGLQLSWAGANGTTPIAELQGGTPVRFAVDGYRVIVLETADYGAAFTVLKKLQASSKAAFITELSKNGTTVYQVTEGVYPNASAAMTALAKWTSAGVAAGFPSLTPASVAGPWAVESGPYATLNDADAAVQTFGKAGLDAFLTVKPGNGTLTYEVRVGQAADPAQLPALQQAALAAGLNAVIPAAGDPYAVVRNDLTAGGSANVAVPLYAVGSAASGYTLRADPSSEEGIEVVERSKRSYRGSMEISALNNNLAVVNVVDLEQYLYSVVGAEIGSSWPAEAQKAQAVAARSYALSVGMQFQIANVVDNIYSQAYNGISSENVNSAAGVSDTAGEVLVSGGKIINAVFSADAGGITADPSEIWGNSADYLASAVTSPDDGPQRGKLDWYKVALSSGQVGYIRSDLLADQGQTNGAGLKVLQVTSNGVAVRPSPQVQTNVNPITRVDSGTLVVPLARVPEYSSYSWVEGPFTGDQLLTSINSRISSASSKIQGPLLTLEVSQTGPSGRAVRVKANGSEIPVMGDGLRGALGGVKSTLLTIEETGRYTVLGADGATVEAPTQSGQMTVLGADGATRDTGGGGNLFVLDGISSLRAVTTTPQFIISGKGFGHGLGMSQWGAKALAEQGYDYQSILQYYYKNVTIEKDGHS